MARDYCHTAHYTGRESRYRQAEAFDQDTVWRVMGPTQSSMSPALTLGWIGKWHCTAESVYATVSLAFSASNVLVLRERWEWPDLNAGSSFPQIHTGSLGKH